MNPPSNIWTPEERARRLGTSPPISRRDAVIKAIATGGGTVAVLLACLTLVLLALASVLWAARLLVRIAVGG